MINGSLKLNKMDWDILLLAIILSVNVKSLIHLGIISSVYNDDLSLFSQSYSDVITLDKI